MKPWITFRKSPLAKLAGDRDGVAAMEFGLLLPLFALGFLAMLDVGLAVNERMNLDRILRSGAELAMSGVEDVSEIEDAVMNAGDDDPDDPPPTIGSVNYSLSIVKTCECSGAGAACNSLCAGDEPPSVYFDLNSSRTMDPLMLPAFDVSSSLRIQIR